MSRKSVQRFCDDDMRESSALKQAPRLAFSKSGWTEGESWRRALGHTWEALSHRGEGTMAKPQKKPSAFGL
ncbi:hypothetical protein E5S70_34885 [Ensifer adhaerens]|nr:hypothetical protein [Ensifer canadensis]